MNEARELVESIIAAAAKLQQCSDEQLDFILLDLRRIDDQVDTLLASVEGGGE